MKFLAVVALTIATLPALASDIKRGDLVTYTISIFNNNNLSVVHSVKDGKYCVSTRQYDWNQINLHLMPNLIEWKKNILATGENRDCLLKEREELALFVPASYEIVLTQDLGDAMIGRAAKKFKAIANNYADAKNIYGMLYTSLIVYNDANKLIAYTGHYLASGFPTTQDGKFKVGQKVKIDSAIFGTSQKAETISSIAHYEGKPKYDHICLEGAYPQSCYPANKIVAAE